MDDNTSKPHSAKDEILALARKHGVSYTPTALDELGNAMSRLADNEAELDEPGRLVLALNRAGHITDETAARLHADYLREKYE